MFCPVTYLLFSLGPFRIIAMQSQYISSFPQSKSQQTSSQNPSRICIAYSIAVFLFYVLYIKSHQPQTNHNLQFFVCLSFASPKPPKIQQTARTLEQSLLTAQSLTETRQLLQRAMPDTHSLETLLKESTRKASRSRSRGLKRASTLEVMDDGGW